MIQDHLSQLASTLGAEIRAARERSRISQRRLSANAGIGRVTLAGLETGAGQVASLVTVLEQLDHRFEGQPAEVPLGRWLADRRKRCGISQDRLCGLAGVSKPAIVAVEHDRGHVHTLLAMMSALGLSIRLVSIETHARPRLQRPAPTARILQGDCCGHMQAMAGQGVLFDAIVTDPPYHLAPVTKRFDRRGATALKGCEPGSANPYRSMATGFMGQGWDGSGVAFDVETWRAAYEVLKPGGYLVAFGSSRTSHRLAVAIEDAGFEVRDTIMWVYGSGFPKSLNVGRGIEGLKRGNSRYNGRTMPSEEVALAPGRMMQEMATGKWTGRSVSVADPDAQRWQGHGTALKPAYEPILIARKPLAEANVAANVLRFGTGSLNIDACRVPTADLIEQGRETRQLGASVALEGRGLPATRRAMSDADQYATDWEHQESASAPSMEMEAALGAMDLRGYQPDGRWPANFIHDGSEAVLAGFPQKGRSRGGGGSKVAGKNVYGRYKGAHYSGDVGFGDEGSAARFFYTAKASKADRGAGNTHPTVKPNDLMRYLVRLVTPPGGIVLDPFSGSGSTGVAALQEGFNFVGCELVEEYVGIARRRIESVIPREQVQVIMSVPSMA